MRRRVRGTIARFDPSDMRYSIRNFALALAALAAVACQASHHRAQTEAVIAVMDGVPYIDRGADHQVYLGARYLVFDPGIDRKTSPKATLDIERVYASCAMARVIDMVTPVNVGDELVRIDSGVPIHRDEHLGFLGPHIGVYRR